MLAMHAVLDMLKNIRYVKPKRKIGVKPARIRMLNQVMYKYRKINARSLKDGKERKINMKPI